MIDLNETASKTEHEKKIAEYLTHLDPKFGALLAPYLKFSQLDALSESDRKRIRSEITLKVQALILEEDSGS